ncbi:RNA-directed DNA methylation 4 [Benincasa hispida]|uniref:RNA-directed DNA methylation 4 n=1 Tax=Benincasa hispida TaxID=102211 RepID=UPI00190120FC|nr:RNA-directed DNA methylation 4 [Benincasa hispida]XP_038885562.1 RNA-directed DNA methylation 4 [Benincasa hispida]
MASIGESSSSVPKLVDEKPVLVRVKRKASQSRLDALWLEINERPSKRPLLDFENLSISETFHKEELKTKKIFVQHVETLRSSEATVDIVQSFGAPDAASTIENNLKNEERRRKFKKEISRQDQLLVKARQEQEVLAKNARFEQIWRSRKGVKDSKDDQLHDIYHIYDIVRLDANEISIEAPKQEEQMSLDDQSMLSSYLPLLREFIPSAAAEIESDIDANMMKQDLPIDDYVYDYYTVKDNVEIADDDASNPFPLIQVDDLDLYDGPDDSDYESDDSNAENNPCFDYPDEVSDEEELESGSLNDELEDNDDDKQSSESNELEDVFSEEDKIQLYEDEIYGDFDEDDADSFDYDTNGGHDEGEDWRWSYR